MKHHAVFVKIHKFKKKAKIQGFWQCRSVPDFNEKDETMEERSRSNILDEINRSLSALQFNPENAEPSMNRSGGELTLSFKEN